jgi:hypothetical protein
MNLLSVESGGVATRTLSFSRIATTGNANRFQYFRLHRSYSFGLADRFEGKKRGSLTPPLINMGGYRSITEGNMKLVRFDDWKTGLLVQLPIGLRVIDVVESLGALSLEGPISGMLNSILKDRGSWAPLIEHWGQASIGLRHLAVVAAFSPNNLRLVIRRLDEIHFCSSGNPNDVAALEISGLCEVAHDPAWRERALQQRALLPRADECLQGRVVRLDAHRRFGRLEGNAVV